MLPLANTLECIELTGSQSKENGDQHMINVRGDFVPYIRLREYLNLPGERPAIEQIMLVETEEGRFGLVVDQVLGNCSTVIKSLGRCFRGVQIVSGATILGNGTVALVVDAQRLVLEAILARVRRIAAHARPLRQMISMFMQTAGPRSPSGTQAGARHRSAGRSFNTSHV